MPVEIFKTNVSEVQQANQICLLLHLHFPNYRVNFDLNDCDRILRIESEKIHIDQIKKVSLKIGFECEWIP